MQKLCDERSDENARSVSKKRGGPRGRESEGSTAGAFKAENSRHLFLGEQPSARASLTQRECPASEPVLAAGLSGLFFLKPEWRAIPLSISIVLST